MPSAERRLWTRIKGRQLQGFRFRRQFSIGPYIVDFHCPEINLAIELDGDSHFVCEEKLEKDRQRQEYIESCGVKMIRFTNEDVRLRLDGVLDSILRELDALKKDNIH